jgi:hypothetical protein
MIILSNFVQFCNFALSLLPFFEIFWQQFKLFQTFKLSNFWTQNRTAMVKDKHVNVAVAYPP